MIDRSRSLYLPQQAVAELLDVSPRTLERWRCRGYGPPFLKFGSRVLYARDDLEKWAAAQRRTSTSSRPR